MNIKQWIYAGWVRSFKTDSNSFDLLAFYVLGGMVFTDQPWLWIAVFWLGYAFVILPLVLKTQDKYWEVTCIKKNKE